MANKHPCYGECGRNVDRDKLMCRECWYLLSPSLRAQVNRAWARFEKNPAANMRQYEGVRDQAIAYVLERRQANVDR